MVIAGEHSGIMIGWRPPRNRKLVLVLSRSDQRMSARDTTPSVSNFPNRVPPVNLREFEVRTRFSGALDRAFPIRAPAVLLLLKLLNPAGVAAVQDEAALRAVVATSLSAITAYTGVSGFLSTQADSTNGLPAPWRRALRAVSRERALQIVECHPAQSPGYGTTCPCEPTKAALEMSRPTIEGTSAIVVWTIHARGRDGVLYGNGYTMRLAREGGVWKVTSITLTWAT